MGANMKKPAVKQRTEGRNGAKFAGAVLCAQLFCAAANAEPPLGLFHQFVGEWSCKGSFAASGATIAGDLSIKFDERSGALIVHHDDVAPGAYHALEVWMANKSATNLRAAISDKSSGMRWLESPGWLGNTLTWTRLENGIAAEQFAYEFKDDSMHIAWSVAQGGAMKLGDSLVCHGG
jgi:hypothetical protein